MNRWTRTLSPSITSLIRLDHSHVLATFHQYHAGTSPGRKAALAGTVCLALEIHAQLEEELFYPELRALSPPGGKPLSIVEKSTPEHDEMRRLIAELRRLDAGDPAFDRTFSELMRDVMHHVADEETTLLPAAEELLPPERLAELGAQMTRRRAQLLLPRAGELARHTLRSLPHSAIVMGAGAVAAGAYLLGRVSPWDRPGRPGHPSA
ncbi:MAG: hemerythrin domain-containing protein [Burkholderiales bacterium]|nr:hemerythrin domain-containing protein [Burkholderiales bacterium]